MYILIIIHFNKYIRNFKCKFKRNIVNVISISYTNSTVHLGFQVFHLIFVLFYFSFTLINNFFKCFMYLFFTSDKTALNYRLYIVYIVCKGSTSEVMNAVISVL